MNTITSPGIEAAVAAVFLEIYKPTAEALGLQIEASNAAVDAKTDRLIIRVQATGEEPAVKIPGGYTASLLEVYLDLHYSTADHNEDWVRSTTRAIEQRRNEIADLELESTAPFAGFEMYENGGQPFAFDNDKTLKQFAGTVCAVLHKTN